MASELTIYHNMHDILSYEVGIILKGEAILIPSALRGDITKRIHSAHMGYNSMIRHAKLLVYWPIMSRNIKQVVDTCAPCQELRPHNQKETLKIHDDGNGPWDKVSSDLFEIDGRQYLVVVDNYSNFIEIDSLQSTTSIKIISCLKMHFSHFGIPRILTTDPGPKFTAPE